MHANAIPNPTIVSFWSPRRFGYIRILCQHFKWAIPSILPPRKKRRCLPWDSPWIVAGAYHRDPLSSQSVEPFQFETLFHWQWGSPSISRGSWSSSNVSFKSIAIRVDRLHHQIYQKYFCIQVEKIRWAITDTGFGGENTVLLSGGVLYEPGLSLISYCLYTSQPVLYFNNHEFWRYGCGFRNNEHFVPYQ